MSTRNARSIASLAPTVTITSVSGSYRVPKRSPRYSVISTHSSCSPRLPVYAVYPFCTLFMAALRIYHGVTKSGSPTPRESASGIFAVMSKNSRMPEGFIVWIVLFSFIS